MFSCITVKSALADSLSDRDMLAAYCVGYYHAMIKEPITLDYCLAAENGETNICSKAVAKKRRYLDYLISTGADDKGDVWSIAKQGENAYQNCEIEGRTDAALKFYAECDKRYGYSTKEGENCVKSYLRPSCEPLKPCYSGNFLPF